MKIGIVGAENSHAAAVAHTLNIEKACGRARVAAIWGETKKLAEKTASEGKIPEVVSKPEQMIDRIDGVMIDHRHPKYHAEAARPFIEAGIPTFVDKPFTYSLKQGVKLLNLARKKGVPITSFSVIPLQKIFRSDFLRQIRSAGKITTIASFGPGDFRSKWGGVFFYGIHQVDAILKAFGPGIREVFVIRSPRGNKDVTAVMKYGNGGAVSTSSFISGGGVPFTFRAFGTKGAVDYENRFDPNPYLQGIRKFVSMFRTGKEPYSPEEILEPIAVLEALDRSWHSGKRVRVKRISGLS